ncbi:MAG TPA: orotidine-5'-phosphate decarboxylase [Candidatus Brocadiia bacterium]|nr:orotidine-5'-phosphate decarboxylase [Planctomycetota bacterium]MDO8093495.1 orotidine-5'-phosphate decarboxylase [Candidatus Brocadiales bacterium]
MKNFADRLIEIIGKKNTPVCVGLDPSASGGESIPQKITQSAYKRFGKGLRGTAEAIYQFNLSIIDITSPYIGIVKPQIAFYEACGYWGIKAYIDTIKYAHKKGLIVIGDIKRGDVPHTAEAYAEAHLGGPYATDAVTVNPYLGEDSIAPFIKMAEKFGKGVFVLVKTTNPSSSDFQDLLVGHPPQADNVPLHRYVAEKVNQWGKPLIGKSRYSSIGAVLSADAARHLRTIMPKSFFLIPGFGAQGATAKDVKHCFNPDGYGAIISASRSIIYAWTTSPWKEKYGPKKWEQAVEAAIIEMKKAIGWQEKNTPPSPSF